MFLMVTLSLASAPRLIEERHRDFLATHRVALALCSCSFQTNSTHEQSSRYGSETHLDQISYTQEVSVGQEQETD